MIVNTVQISTGAKVYLIDEFLTTDILAKVKTLFGEFGTNDSWKIPDWTQGRPRYVYTGQSKEYTEFCEYIKSTEVLGRLGQILNTDVQNTGIDFWIDFAGFGTLAPHYENEGSIYLTQIYVSDKEYPFIGTTIYNENQQILFQLPFRDNYGWLFDKGYTVMHGRAHDIPDNLARCSIMLWFDKK